MDKILSKVFLTEKVEECMSLEIKEKINNNVSILEEYAKKYKPEELTTDGIPNIETQLKELKEKDEERENKLNEVDKDKIYRREMIQRVKCLSLNKMGKDILNNSFDMNSKDKKRLQEIMWTYNDIEHNKIIQEFNELVCDMLDDIKTTDYSKLPIYDI